MAAPPLDPMVWLALGQELQTPTPTHGVLSACVGIELGQAVSYTVSTWPLLQLGAHAVLLRWRIL